MLIRICFIILFLSSCSNDPDHVKNFITDLKDVPVEVLSDVYIIHTEYGNLKMKLEAAKIKSFIEPKPILKISGGLKVEFYDKNENLVSSLNAEEGVIDESQKVMIVEKNVLLESVNNKKLKTSELIWNEKKNLVYTKKNVIIQTKGETIMGSGFESNPDFSRYKINKVYGDIVFEKK